MKICMNLGEKIIALIEEYCKYAYRRLIILNLIPVKIFFRRVMELSVEFGSSGFGHLWAAKRLAHITYPQQTQLDWYDVF